MPTPAEMTVVLVTPPGVAEVVKAGCELADLQRLVGGDIEAVRVTPSLWLVCNEAGRVNGLEFMAEVAGHEVFGSFFLCRTAGGEFIELDDQEALTIAERINAGEEFVG